MFTPEDFASLYPDVTSRCLEIEAYIDTCLRRGQLLIITTRTDWSAVDIKAVHAKYVAAGWSVELCPGPGPALMRFHTARGDEVTKP